MNRNTFSKSSNQVDYLKYILIGLVLFGVIALIWTNHVAKKTDEELIQDFSTIQQSTQKLSIGEIDVASFEKLQQKYPKEYLIAYQLGYAYLTMGNMQPALTMYTRAIDLNPYLVENNEFMYQYALVLANNEQKDSAKTVIARAQQLPGDENYIQRLESLLTQVEQ